jgi:hypothetical protein
MRILVLVLLCAQGGCSLLFEAETAVEVRGADAGDVELSEASCPQLSSGQTMVLQTHYVTVDDTLTVGHGLYAQDGLLHLVGISIEDGIPQDLQSPLSLQDDLELVLYYDTSRDDEDPASSTKFEGREGSITFSALCEDGMSGTTSGAVLVALSYPDCVIELPDLAFEFGGCTSGD